MFRRVPMCAPWPCRGRDACVNRVVNSSNESHSPLVLVLEASGPHGSVALLRVPAVLQRRDVAMGIPRTDQLFPAVLEVLEAAGAVAADVDVVVCGGGPGSFTSLRIAAAIAKGLVHATGAQLVSVPSLLLAAATYGQAGRYLVHADALRGDRYALPAVIDTEGMVRADGAPLRVAQAELPAVAGTRTLLAVRDAGMARDAIAEVPAWGAAVSPDAAALLHILDWDRGVVPLDAWEPDYGRLAEAQVKWEAAHHQPLPSL